MPSPQINPSPEEVMRAIRDGVESAFEDALPSEVEVVRAVTHGVVEVFPDEHKIVEAVAKGVGDAFPFRAELLDAFRSSVYLGTHTAQCSTCQTGGRLCPIAKTLAR